jgi:putative membrane protein insertion efficiency factor
MHSFSASSKGRMHTEPHSGQGQPVRTSGLAWLLNRLLIGLIHGYRYILSPWIGQHCRFYPSCSCYAIEALETHGPAKGSYLTLRRLLRCHPWHPGGADPVPHACHRDD